MNRLLLITFVVLCTQCASLAFASQSTFATLEFDDVISVEVPRNWTYLDEKIKNHINNFSEAVAKLSNISLNQGNNNVLVAASAYTSSNTPSATLRVSVRPDKTPSQTEIKQLTKASKADLKELFEPMVAETKRAMLTVDGVKNVLLVSSVPTFS